jgi:hypothetical protein
MGILRIQPLRIRRMAILLSFLFVAVILAGPLKTAHALPAVANGSDPYADGCAGGHASWYVVESASIYDDVGSQVGYVQLWYSATCATNWTRVVPYSSVNGLIVSLYAWNAGTKTWQFESGSSASCQSYCWDAETGSYDLRTGQYAIPGPAKAHGCIIEPSGRGGCADAAQPTK